MKTLRSRSCLLALLFGASALVACSSDTGESFKDVGSGENPPNVGTPPASSPGLPALKAARGSSAVPVDPATTSIVTGVVTDVGGGLPSLGLGGQGTVSTVAAIRLSELTASGELKFLSGVGVDASGSFSARLPLGIGMIIAQALNASGQVIGSVIVGGSGSVAGNLIVAAPITTETSVEAEILLSVSRCQLNQASHGGALGLSLDVAALVDAEFAAAIAAAVKAGVDLDVLVRAVANAAVAAARARVQTLIDAGVKVDLDALVAAKLGAIQRLNVGLTSALNGQASLADVVAQLLADLDAAIGAGANVSANLRVRAQVAAHLAFSATLTASLSAVAQADAVVFAALHATAKIEAQLATWAVVDILWIAGAASVDVDAAVAAGVKLQADVAAATSIAALARARLTFVATLSGSGQPGGSGGLLGAVLAETTGSVQVLLGSVLDTVSKLSAELDAKLRAQAKLSADVCLDARASVDLDVNLRVLVQALAKFTADVQALAPSLQTGTTTELTARALADLVATAEVVLRVQW